MDNNIKNGSNGQGPVSDTEVPSVDVIVKWMDKDLGACISFLRALHDDAALKQQMAVYLQGRISNFSGKVDPKQAALDFGVGPKASA